jgi:hypothetical protein
MNLDDDSIEVVLHDSYIVHSGMDRQSGGPVRIVTPQESSDDRVAYEKVVKASQDHGAVVTTSSEAVDKSQGLLARNRPNYFDGGYDTYHLVETVIRFAYDHGWAMMGTSVPVLIAWIKCRSGRSVTIKSGGHEVILKGSGDIDKAKETIEELRRLDAPRKGSNAEAGSKKKSTAT